MISLAEDHYIDQKLRWENFVLLQEKIQLCKDSIDSQIQDVEKEIATLTNLRDKTHLVIIS